MNAPYDSRTDPPVAPVLGSGTAKPSRLWLWFIAAFVLQALAWTTWFIIAAHNKVEEVPLAPAHSR